MAEYQISNIYPSDRRAQAQVDALLHAEGIRKDTNLDYTCAIYDDDMNIIATGSCFGSTLRCLAVSHQHQGEGLMNLIVTHLTQVQFSRGNTHLFLYTKCDSSDFFASLGFYEIARVPDQIVFMENKRHGFSDYLASLSDPVDQPDAHIAAIVMNANPFTLGHQYLIETAASENDWLHLFLVSEDRSLFPAHIRKDLVKTGIAHLHNVTLHETASYMISQATFPGYFQKDSHAVLESQARLDLAVFHKIAEHLHITCRYAGEEPASVVTHLYNEIMKQELPSFGIHFSEIPRLTWDNIAVSASTVRQAIKEDCPEMLPHLLPASTLSYLQSPAAAPVIQRIKETADVKHY